MRRLPLLLCEEIANQPNQVLAVGQAHEALAGC